MSMLNWVPNPSTRFTFVNGLILLTDFGAVFSCPVWVDFISESHAVLICFREAARRPGAHTAPKTILPHHHVVLAAPMLQKGRLQTKPDGNVQINRGQETNPAQSFMIISGMWCFGGSDLNAISPSAWIVGCFGAWTNIMTSCLWASNSFKNIYFCCSAFAWAGHALVIPKIHWMHSWHLGRNDIGGAFYCWKQSSRIWVVCQVLIMNQRERMAMDIESAQSILALAGRFGRSGMCGGLIWKLILLL